MTDAVFGPDAFQAHTGATEAQMADVEAYRALLAEWSAKMNLVGPSAMESFWLRHAWDSAQLLSIAPERRVWADIGAGAGFPGLILGIFSKETPGAHVHLIESMAKKCRFLTAAAEALALPVTVHNARAEDLRLTGVEVVTARACAPVDRLLGYAAPLFRQGAIGLFLKGQGVDAEIAEAHKSWRFRADLIPSRSSAEGRIVKVEAISRG
jgi:16S rRNA (guanine527-N7)-methyltransferase